jgi:hypothetical protein
MRTSLEPDTIAELITDCDDIPTSLQAGDAPLPLPRPAAAWQVTDEAHAQVDDLDEYV